MSKFFIVFCIALFASAAFGAPLDNDQRKKAEKSVKGVCENIIQDTLLKMMDTYSRSLADEPEPEPERENKASRYATFVNAGLRAVGKLIKDVDGMKLIDDNELASMDPGAPEGAPVNCPENVLTALSEIKSNLFAEFLG